MLRLMISLFSSDENVVMIVVFESEKIIIILFKYYYLCWQDSDPSDECKHCI